MFGLASFRLYALDLFSILFPSRMIARRLARLPLGRDLVFVRVGANDGVQGHRIRKIACDLGWFCISIPKVLMLTVPCGWTLCEAPRKLLC